MWEFLQQALFVTARMNHEAKRQMRTALNEPTREVMSRKLQEI